MNKRSQSALEFLVTYGWAIMAILIAIGALAYFGLTGSGNLLPDKCYFSTGIQCADYQLATVAGITDLSINLRNSLGFSIYTVDLSVDAIGTGTQTTCTPNALDNVNTFSPGQRIRFVCHGFPAPGFLGVAPTIGQKVRMRLNFNYQKLPGGSAFTHTALGDVYTTAQ